MNYTIISIDDSRKEKKQAIEAAIKLPRVRLQSFNGRDPEQLKQAENLWPEIDNSNAEHRLNNAEKGIWYGQVAAWEFCANVSKKPLLILEDDAILSDDFDTLFREVLEHVEYCDPEWHGISLFVPDDQVLDFTYNFDFIDGYQVWRNPRYVSGGAFKYRTVSPIMARAYQGYGCVANVFTPAGAKYLLDRAVKRGMYQPVDCFIFEAQQSNWDNFRLYTPRPEYPRLTWVDWNAPTLKGD